MGVELLLVDVPFFFGAKDSFWCFWNGFAVGFTTSLNMKSAKETHIQVNKPTTIHQQCAPNNAVRTFFLSLEP